MVWPNSLSVVASHFHEYPEKTIGLMFDVADETAPADSPSRWKGYVKDISELFAEKLNLTSYTLFDGYNPTIEWTNGRLLSNGSWNGMLGMIDRGEADLLIDTTLVHAERYRHFETSLPILDLMGMNRAIVRNSKKSLDLFTFVAPFDLYLWLLFLGSFLVVTLTTTTIYKCSNGDQTKNSNFSIGDILWNLFSITTMFGPSDNFRSTGIRIIMCGWYATILILVSSYTANLAAFLTADKMQMPITKLSDIPSHKNIPLVAERYIWENMMRTKSSDAGVVNEILARYESGDAVVIDDSCYDSLKSMGQFVFIGPTGTIIKNFENEPNAAILPGILHFNENVIFMKKNRRDLLHAVDLALIELRRKGELNRLNEKYFSFVQGTAKSLSSETDKDMISLGITPVAGVFLGLAICWVVGVLVACYEKRVSTKTFKFKLEDPSFKQ